jgi:hypothetical protein
MRQKLLEHHQELNLLLGWSHFHALVDYLHFLQWQLASDHIDPAD